MAMAAFTQVHLLKKNFGRPTNMGRPFPFPSLSNANHYFFFLQVVEQGKGIVDYLEKTLAHAETLIEDLKVSMRDVSWFRVRKMRNTHEPRGNRAQSEKAEKPATDLQASEL